jgi:hypothetical protein
LPDGILIRVIFVTAYNPNICRILTHLILQRKYKSFNDPIVSFSNTFLSNKLSSKQPVPVFVSMICKIQADVNQTGARGGIRLFQYQHENEQTGIFFWLSSGKVLILKKV